MKNEIRSEITYLFSVDLGKMGGGGGGGEGGGRREGRVSKHGTNRGACCCRQFSESQVKAVRKRCILRLDLKDVRDGENRLCIGTEFHTLLRRMILERPCTGAFQVNTQGSSLSEDDRRDLWGVYEERQYER